MSETKNIDSNLGYGVYVVYDSILKKYDAPFIVPQSSIMDDVKFLVNTYGSKYYYHETDYILYYLGLFDTDTGLFSFTNPEKLCVLSDLVDQKLRDKQTILHTLNTIPVGYHKMPEEMRKEIQDNIDKAIQDYVTNFCDLDSLSKK